MKFPPETARRRRKMVSVVFAGVLLTAGCGGGSDTGGSDNAGGGSLIIAVAADPRSLFPNSSTAQQEINVSEQITEKLIEYTADGSGFEPRLATEWKQLDPTTVRLSLRHDVTFTNGEKFNAEGAAKSIEIMRHATAYKSFVSMVSGAKAVDEYTLDVTSDKPTGLMLNALAMGSFQYPAKYFDEVGEEKFGTSPIGTGPYTLAKWTKGVDVTLKANPGYWGDKPKISDVTFKVVPDASAQVAAIQSGQIGFMYDVPVGSLDSIKKDSALTVADRPSNRLYSLTLSSVSDTPLKDPAVRRALQYGIDVPSIIKNQLGGLGTPLQGQILAPYYVGFDDTIKATPFDPAKAKQLLAEAGYPDGFSVTFKYPSGRYAQDREVGQAIASQLAAIGVKTNQEVLESGTFLSQLLDKKLNDMYFGGSLTAPDAHMMYEQYIEGAPYTYYANNPDVNKLVAEEATTVDQAKRKEIISQISKIFVENPPFVPLYQGTDLYAMSKNITGFTPRASQFLDVRTLASGQS